MKKAKIVTRNGNQVIDFPCQAFKQYLLNNFDADGDGEISLDVSFRAMSKRRLWRWSAVKFPALRSMVMLADGL